MKVKIKKISLFLFISSICICFVRRILIKPGLNVILLNKTSNSINYLEFRGSSDNGEKVVFSDVKPKSTSSSNAEFSYLAETAMFYKNAQNEQLTVPVMYSLNGRSRNTVIFTIYSFNKDGSISEYKTENNLDNNIYLKSFILMLFSNK